MSVTDTHASVDHHGGDVHSEHHPDSYYVKIALVLAVITGLEVALSYAGLKGFWFLFPLLLMMAIKFVTVVLLFMHLRFDSKWFNMAFWAGLLLAIAVYAATLTTFHFFA